MAEAHVAMPADMRSPGDPATPRQGDYRNHYLGRAGVETMSGGLEWIRFMNPGDLRITDLTCARAGCHVGATEKVKRSVMSTLVGKYDAMLELAGSPRAAGVQTTGDESFDKHLATYGAVAVTDPDFDLATAPPGAVPELAALVSVDREDDRPFGVFNEQDVLTETMNKLCGNCHLNNNGANDKYGTFRSSGCSACHMPYDYSGRSASSDPAIPKDEPAYPAAYTAITYPERPHPRTHQLKRVMSSEDCLACHTGSNRTVFQFMGIRTDDNRDLTRARAAGKDIDFRYATLIDNALQPEARLHGFTQDQLIEYEDLDDDGVDDTLPDVHYEAGLECIDCHTAAEMHGDGKIYSRQNQATQVRCVHCHGNLEYEADPDGDDNPINQLYAASGKEERKYLWRFERVPGYGEVGFPYVTQPGIWLRAKSSGAWKYATQIKWSVMWDPESGDCIEEGRRIDPRTNTFVCSARGSVGHGRWDGLAAAQGDLRNGVGPRPGVEVVVGADGQSASVRQGFSHLGEPATAANLNHEGGVECSACHAGWHNMRYGNHLGLQDMVGGQRVYDWDRVTGEETLGVQGWFDFTYVSNLDLQLGVNARGKIAYFIPTRLKLFMRALVLDPSLESVVDFMSIVADPTKPWKTYRDRTGYGNLLYGAGTAQNAPGYAQVCLEPQGFCDRDPRKNLNGALGVDQMEPHSIRREVRRCEGCHLDAAASNRALVGAVYGWNPNGYTRATSAYLRAIDGITTNHGNYTTADGYVIADDGIRHRLDWMVDYATGYPLAGTLHVRTDAGRGHATWDRDTAGPITKPLIDVLDRVRVRQQP
ncbi:MAG: cytochrome c3 family protein [Deltaproteobacteria bacterium]|nr:cytochrome c3 family protein [Kofleriaceae bacterium]